MNYVSPYVNHLRLIILTQTALLITFVSLILSLSIIFIISSCRSCFVMMHELLLCETNFKSRSQSRTRIYLVFLVSIRQESNCSVTVAVDDFSMSPKSSQLKMKSGKEKLWQSPAIFNNVSLASISCRLLTSIELKGFSPTNCRDRMTYVILRRVGFSIADWSMSSCIFKFLASKAVNTVLRSLISPSLIEKNVCFANVALIASKSTVIIFSLLSYIYKILTIS